MTSKSDDVYADMMREILFAEPCRGLTSEPSQLLDHMFIGSQSNAENLRGLRHIGVTHVLNCAGYKGPRPTPLTSPYEGLGIDYFEFKAEDNEFYDITRHFPDAFAFLEKVRRAGGVALVHCALGINRSAAVCVGYMMVHGRLSLLEATRIIKAKRRVVLANRGFHRQLVRYARAKGFLDHIQVPAIDARTRRQLPEDHSGHQSCFTNGVSVYSNGISDDDVMSSSRKSAAAIPPRAVNGVGEMKSRQSTRDGIRIRRQHSTGSDMKMRDVDTMSLMFQAPTNHTKTSAYNGSSNGGHVYAARKHPTADRVVVDSLHRSRSSVPLAHHYSVRSHSTPRLGVYLNDVSKTPRNTTNGLVTSSSYHSREFSF